MQKQVSEFQVAAAVLRFGLVLPLVGSVCLVSREVLQHVQDIHDRGDVDAPQDCRILAVLKALVWIAENVKTLKDPGKEYVARFRGVGARARGAAYCAHCTAHSAAAAHSRGFYRPDVEAARTFKHLDGGIRL